MRIRMDSVSQASIEVGALRGSVSLGIRGNEESLHKCRAPFVQCKPTRFITFGSARDGCRRYLSQFGRYHL